MYDLNTSPRAAILTFCREAAPNPWYPSNFVQASGFPRERLDPVLDELRLGGLIRLTDWVQGKGQGYALTPAGEEVAGNARLLEKVNSRGVPAGEPVRLRAPAPGDGQPTPWERGEVVREALLNQRLPVVTLAILFVNLLVFAIGGVIAYRQDVPLNKYVWGFVNPTQDPVNADKIFTIQRQSGALLRSDIYPGLEWWRLVTSCFVHFGLLHLLLNMYSLFMLGPIMESIWGPVRFLIVYLIAGVGGSVAMVVFERGFGAGASGAIWGVMASLIAWLYLNRSALPPNLVGGWLRQLLIILAFNIYFTFAVKEVSKAGHFAGGLVGLAVSLPLNYYVLTRGWRRALAAAAVAAVPVVLLVLLAWSFREQWHWNEVVVPRLTALGQEADELYEAARKKDQDSPRAIREGIKETGRARELLREAMDLIRAAGPYRDRSIEEVRERALNGFERREKEFRQAEALLNEVLDKRETRPVE